MLEGCLAAPCGPLRERSWKRRALRLRPSMSLSCVCFWLAAALALAGFACRLVRQAQKHIDDEAEVLRVVRCHRGRLRPLFAGHASLWRTEPRRLHQVPHALSSKAAQTPPHVSVEIERRSSPLPVSRCSSPRWQSTEQRRETGGGRPMRRASPASRDSCLRVARACSAIQAPASP